MSIKDAVRAAGQVRVQIHGPDGQLKDEFIDHNLIVDAGKDWIAARMDDSPPTAMTHMAVGTGATAAAGGDTTLGSESARVALDSTVNTSNQVTFTATFGPGVGTAALTEAGIFDAGAGGTMLARIVYAVINKGAADTMTITWDVTIN